MADNIKELIQQRGTIKGRLTKFKDFLAGYTKLELQKISKSQIGEIQVKLTIFEQLLKTFDEIQTKIENLSPNFDEQLNERETVENSFCAAIAAAREFIDSSSEISTNKEHFCSSQYSSSSEKNNYSHIKLPTIKLPNFDGNYLKWMEFRDIFDSLINKNDSIPSINKFHYLRSSLEGAAAVVIKSIAFSSSNYSLAWDLICERFNNKRILIQNHLKSLFNFDLITKESYKSLRFLLDHVSKNLRALNSLGEPTEQWDTLIIFLMTSKLDGATSRNWEEHRNTLTDSPSLTDFYQFLRNRADVLETLQLSKNEFTRNDKPYSPYKENKQTKSFITSSTENSFQKSCVLCKRNHRLYECENFKAMSPCVRLHEVEKFKLCTNCLRSGHHNSRCRLAPCRICRKKHNTLLHITRESISKTENIQENSNVPSTSSASPVALSAMVFGQVLLCTAQVELVNLKTNKIYLARALLDSGSQSSFLSENMRRKMDLSCSNVKSINVAGINNSVINTTAMCEIQLKSRVNLFKTNMSCLVIPFITGKLPHVEINPNNLDLPNNIQLADPNFFYPSEVDILIGADIYWDIIDSNQIRLGNNKPTLQNSKLGWLVAGPTGAKQKRIQSVQCNFIQEIKESLAKFWEIEELPQPIKLLTSDEQFCEEHFLQNTKRLNDGRFSVKIPLRERAEKALGDSYYIAKKRFLNLERKLDRSIILKQKYHEFINGYKDLGHMSEIKRPQFGIYLPHHAVIRECSETTPVRGVFDASCKTLNGKSLNDIQMVGPVIQDDLFSILIRFRQNAYVVTGDIEKMYRQIRIDESQRNLQLIFWRDKKDQPLKIFQLNTVTYGTASAPYLSTRCLVELANNCEDETVANVIRHDFYVDDLNTGFNCKSILKDITNAVISKLAEGCFILRKFRTNVPDIFREIPLSHQKQDFCKDSTVLGLNWSPSSDILQFSTKVETDSVVTKRSILSTTCKIFDPLGLLSACTIIPKMLIQQLWLTKLDWDEPIPENLKKQWDELLTNSQHLSSISVPRHVLIETPINVEIHCFCDASMNAYAACLYLKSFNSLGDVEIHLLCSKARVSPLKPMTIPRLELCGALLGARLHAKVTQALRIKISKSVFWSDSTVVLGWINSNPKTLKTFVCNRIQEIRDLTCQHTWRHVPTGENPADLASRGINPQGLNNNSLWWHGPSFLLQSDEKWPQTCPVEVELPEIKVLISTNNNNSNKVLINFDNYSNLYNLQKIFAYVLRFISNVREKNKGKRITDELTSEDLQSSLVILAKLSQSDSFASEIYSLSNNKSLKLKSNILSLNPFLDNTGILRVGGRIQNASQPYAKTHPILIDSNHTFTKLLFRKKHIQLLHCGPQQLLVSIREMFWPTGGRTLARSTIHKCITCLRARGKTMQPIMGNLPQPRVTPAAPFETCGADFAGPFLILNRKGRGAKTSKCYLCLFVCFSTKALHLEVVSELSTNGFILCLRRFIARRGKPTTIYCDNGTNFVGANNELKRMLESCRRSFDGFACEEGIKFRFIPAYTPNFGGIWEAGVKAAKFHLKRIVGNSGCTFEELTTLFAQIEAILNSRPLTSMSSDPSDLLPLTPGHFLIGRPMVSLPSPAISLSKLTVNRYQHLERLRQHFWDRWSKEFLSDVQQQQRVKWRKKGQGVKLGDLVIIKDENLPPMRWHLGRIQKLYQGTDGTCRVADIKSNKGIVRKAVSRLCALPNFEDDVKES